VGGSNEKAVSTSQKSRIFGLNLKASNKAKKKKKITNTIRENKRCKLIKTKDT
jgi:hypothetical protein